MQITCKCFNVVSSSDQISDVSETVSSASSSYFPALIVEMRDKFEKGKFYNESMDFFSQAVGPVTDLQIKVTESNLVCTIQISNWLLNYCINCNTLTHVQSNDLKSKYFVNAKYRCKNEELLSLKENKLYSPIFGILITEPQKNADFEGAKTSVSSTGNSLQRLNNLKKKIHECLLQEIVDTNERIRLYNEEQFSLLANFREKCELDFQIFINLMQHVPENLMTHVTDSGAISHDNNCAINSLDTNLFNKQEAHFDTPPATPETAPMSVGNSPIFQQTNVINSLSSKFSGLHGIVGANTVATNAAVHYAAEINDCIFDLEGLEHYPLSVGFHTNDNKAISDLDDTDDAEDALGQLNCGISISKKNQVPSFNIAKSLPVVIQKSFEDTEKQKHAHYDDSDDEILESNIDIAASIKALAKSVHGDTVFGDLPRPRFSYQI